MPLKCSAIVWSLRNLGVREVMSTKKIKLARYTRVPNVKVTIKVKKVKSVYCRNPNGRTTITWGVESHG